MIYIVLPEGCAAIETDGVISSTNADRAADLARSAAKETGTPHVVHKIVPVSYHPAAKRCGLKGCTRPAAHKGDHYADGAEL